MSEKKSIVIGSKAKAKIEEKSESTAMPYSEMETQIISTKKPKKLVLDEKTYKPSKTRAELYNELLKDEVEKTPEDYYHLASLPMRGLAFIIDIIFTALLINGAIFLAPFELDLVKFLLELNMLETAFSDNLITEVMIGINIFLVLYAGVILPLVLFNCTLGKKFTQLRVRGDDVYTLSVLNSFKREIILKPIGVICLVGFVIPFFDEKRKSFHDKLASTFVIKD